MRLAKVWVNTMVKLETLVQLKRMILIDYIYGINQTTKFISQGSNVRYYFDSEFVLNKLSAHLYREIDINFFYLYQCLFQAEY